MAKLFRSDYLQPALYRGTAFLLVIFFLAVVCAISYRANNVSFPELAGQWRIVRLDNASLRFRYVLWENLIFDIDERGLLGSRRTPLSMMLVPGNCGARCYLVSDNSNVGTGKHYRLELKPTSNEIQIRPSADSAIIAERVVKR